MPFRSYILPQPQRRVVFPWSVPDPFQESPDVPGGNVIRLGFLKHINRIQGVTLDQLFKELAEGLPVAEALHPYDFPIDCEESPDLGIHQVKSLEVICQPVPL